MFHDGCGLASPGRWDIEKRVWNNTPFWNNLRKATVELVLQSCGGLQKLDRMCFEMAAKGEAGCDLMKDKVLEQRLVELWKESLLREGVSEQGLTDVAHGQPFRLRLMEALLDKAGDPDHKFLFYWKGRKVFRWGCLDPYRERLTCMRSKHPGNLRTIHT